MAIVSGNHKGKAQMEWNARVNRARDAFLDNYRSTHQGNPMGSMEAWYGSAQYRELMSQNPHASQGR